MKAAFFLLLMLSIPARAQDAQRGKALYETHCLAWPLREHPQARSVALADPL